MKTTVQSRDGDRQMLEELVGRDVVGLQIGRIKSMREILLRACSGENT